jgi:hypothetical protein
MNKHLMNLWKDVWKNPSIKAGEDFEDGVADEFFPDDLYEMLHRTHDVNTNSKRFIRSSLNPDFQFEIRKTKIQFWIECKHRENNSDSTSINVFKNDQLKRYQSYPNCFLLLCTYRFEEQYFYLVPMADIKWDNLFLSFLKNYEVTMEPPVLPGLIKKYLK